MDAAFGLGIEGNSGEPGWEGAAEPGFWTKHCQGEPDLEFPGGIFFFLLATRDPGMGNQNSLGCLQEFGKARIASSASGSEDPSPAEGLE